MKDSNPVMETLAPARAVMRLVAATCAVRRPPQVAEAQALGVQRSVPGPFGRACFLREPGRTRHGTPATPGD